MKVVITSAYRQFENDIRGIPALMSSGKGISVHEGRNSVRRFSFNGTDVMVKRFKRANYLQRIVYSFFRKTKAERAFRYAEIYRERGIATPDEVAYIEIRRYGLFCDGYFVSLVSPFPPVFRMIGHSSEINRPLADDLAKMVAKMHRGGILNGDLNLGNFLYDFDGSHYHFTMVDINRSIIKDSMPGLKDCLNNLCTITDKADFFKVILESYICCFDCLRVSKDELLETGMSIFRKHKRKARAKQMLKTVLRCLKNKQL